MSLAIAEYTTGAQFSSDGQLYLNFHVTFVDPDAIQMQTSDIQVMIPSGSTVEDINGLITAAISASASDFGFTLDDGGVLFPSFVRG